MMADDLVVILKKKTLRDMAKEAHKLELGCSLKDLDTKEGKERRGVQARWHHARR
jgi:hypothetical protein